MYNLDSLTLKLFIKENKDYLTGAVVQKIQMPSRREFLLSLRNLGDNRKLYINIDPKFPHICFIQNKEKYFIKIPKEPPMFCMLLRKHFEGAKIKSVSCVEYERIIEFYFDTYDEIGSNTSMCFSVELMGKHSNALLYNSKTKIIQGSAHNISPEKSSIREIYGGIEYIYPPKINKTDILKTSFAAFYDIVNKNHKADKAEEINIPVLKKVLCAHYYYLNEALVEFVLKNLCKFSEPILFKTLQNLTAGDDFETLKEFWGRGNNINELIENYFSKLVSFDMLDSKKSKIQKIIKKELKRLENILKTTENTDKYLIYKQKGDIILQNIYKINSGDNIIVENGTAVELDPLKTASENAKRYYSLYSKGKNSKTIQETRSTEAKKSEEYLNEVLFLTKNADNPETLDEISDEISQYLNKNPNRQGKAGSDKKPVKIQSLNFEGYEILVGKNNKQNDYIIKKLTHPEDIWLHSQNSPSGHIFIKTQNGKKPVTEDILLYAARLVKENSPLKESAKAGIIYTKRKYLKRPADTNLGYVTYKGEKEIVV